MIAGRFPSATVAAGHWTINDGRQSVDKGERFWFNQGVDDEGRRSKNEDREERMQLILVIQTT